MNRKPLRTLIIWLLAFTIEIVALAGGMLYVVLFVPGFAPMRGIAFYVGLPFMLIVAGVIAWINIQAHFHPEQERHSMKCERCGQEGPTQTVETKDGNQQTQLCSNCISIVVRSNTAFQVKPLFYIRGTNLENPRDVYNWPDLGDKSQEPHNGIGLGSELDCLDVQGNPVQGTVTGLALVDGHLHVEVK